MFGKRRVYLDFAAGAAGNPSSPHEEGRRAKEMLEKARKQIAELVEVQSDDVIVTSGATESNALAIVGHVRALRDRVGKDVPGRSYMHVLYLPTAHSSTVENVKLLAEEGITIEPLVVTDARVDTDALAKQIRKETVLVTMEAVCGETGVVWNTREVAEVLRQHRGGSFSSLARGTAATHEEKTSSAVLHVDASQAPWTEKITRAHFDADMLTFDGSKVGVRGIGLLIAHRTIPLSPLYRGGGQERGLRPGSEDPERLTDFAAALSAVTSGREAFVTSAREERARLVTALTTALPTLLINEGHTQVPNVLNISLPGVDTDYLVALLDEAGFAVSTKSACETDSLEGSRSVMVLTGDQKRAQATLRISWGPTTTTRDLARFAEQLVRSVAFIDTNGAR